MATEKEKLVEEAQRLLLRGQSDKAIKIYQQVLKLEPSAVNHRQKLAELLGKAGYLKEARVELEIIGKYYSANGFYPKAIAVYKKLQTLFPEDTALTLILAELNEKQGLKGNALAEYRLVYDFHMKRKDVAESLLVLQKMAKVDERNAQVGVMLAEAYFDSGRTEESYRVFSRLAELLQDDKDPSALEKINQRIQQLFPEKKDFMLDMLAGKVVGGRGVEALPGLHALLREDPQNSRTWDILIDAYLQLDQPERLKAAALHCLKYFPEKTSVRKILLQCMVSEGDLASALPLLQTYENEFFLQLLPSQVVELYQGMRQLDPVNAVILTGLERAYRLAGETDQAEAVAASLSSLQAFPADMKSLSPRPEQLDAGTETSKDAADMESATPFLSQPLEIPKTIADGVSNFDLDLDIDIDSDLDLAVFAGNIFDEDPFSIEPGVAAAESGSSRNVRFGNELENRDAQTHHDLGIAFREMGLFEEAAREFMQAAADPAKTVECMLLRSVCLREDGKLDAAETYLKILLQQPLLPAEFSHVKHELAQVYQAAGKMAEAEQILTETRAKKDSPDMGLDFTDDDIDEFDF